MGPRGACAIAVSLDAGRLTHSRRTRLALRLQSFGQQWLMDLVEVMS
jgi:hypothetical protein